MSQVLDDRSCRLLSAAELSYSIDADGNLTCYNQDVYDRIGWIGEPKAFVAGTDEINAGLVGKNKDDGIIVAYRGTLAPEFKGKTFDQDVRILLDWIHDLFVRPISVPELGGKVDENFYGSVQSLWEPMLAEVQRLYGDDTSLFVTGHSKGGPMATIGAAQLHAAGYKPTGVTTFASPRPGDAGFASFYESIVPNTVGYQYQDDLIPHLPPTPAFADALSLIPVIGHFFAEFAKWDFVTVGDVLFIDWNDEIIDVNALSLLKRLDLEARRVAALAKLMIEFRFGQIAGDHSLSGGYCNVICGDGACGS